MKISVIGAGNVGSQAAMRILEHDLGDIVLLDIQGDLAHAKALDLMDAGAISGYKSKILGTSDYALTENSEVVVVNAGFTRRPGMSR
ncbi:MAG: malate dehydrogenase, partial [Candidatus Omnitrophica bacterium]|nr:malate dehydrogenase [Candidatus Omnitrophota bacterium]